MKKGRKVQLFVKAASVIAIVLGVLVGCSVRRAALNQGAETTSLFSKVQEPAEYRIQAGDQLDIKFFFNPELNETVFVRPDGKISLQLIDDVQAGGLTPTELDEKLSQMYAQELKEPEVTVIVRSFTGQRVYVGGEVTTPGLVNLTSGMTALQAVIGAGGFRETAKPDGVIVIRKGDDNRPVPIRVDLKTAIDGDANEGDIPLRSYDVVYVPKTWIAKANKFVTQYIEQLFLYRGASLGFSYELHSADDD